MKGEADPSGRASLSETARLLDDARTGDPAARERLFEIYRPRLVRFLHARLGAGDRSLLDTQDLVQEVCPRALSSLDRFEDRGIGSFWAWLRKISLSRLSDVRRQKARRGAPEPLSEGSIETTATTPGARLLREEEFQAFEKALERVSERERKAVLMRLELDLGYETIASECGHPSPDAARMAIGRAVAKIAREMSHGGSGA